MTILTLELELEPELKKYLVFQIQCITFTKL